MAATMRPDQTVVVNMSGRGDKDIFTVAKLENFADMSSNRIQQRMDALSAIGRKALIPYIVAGDPTPSVTVPAMHAMVEAGADIIELGMPFSDPFADGPLNQRGAERAIAGGTTLSSVLDTVSEFRQTDQQTPVVLMGYLNPVIAMGETAFCDACEKSGVDGLLIVDMPPEEEGSLVKGAKDRGLDLIYLAAPTTTDARLATIGQAIRLSLLRCRV